MARHFYRCTLCLSILAAESAKPLTLDCTACGGSLAHLGVVKSTRLVTFKEETPCDERCTHARGPKCDCPCGAVNHGTGITVTIPQDAGAVPAVTPLNVDAAKARAKEFVAAFAAAKDRYHARFDAPLSRKAVGAFIADEDYYGARAARRLLAEAQAGKTQKGRLKKLAEVLEICNR